MSLNAAFVVVSVLVFIAAAAAPTLIAVPPITLIAVGLAFFAASFLVVRQ